MFTYSMYIVSNIIYFKELSNYIGSYSLYIEKTAAVFTLVLARTAKGLYECKVQKNHNEALT